MRHRIFNPKSVLGFGLDFCFILSGASVFNS